MAHIANKIDAKDKQLAEILSNQRYRVDSFQREYRWQRKHIEALISDLSISFLNSYKDGDTIEDSISYDCYYMGPVVLCQDRAELSIVDGQQRLTSFTLLIIFLYHVQNQLQNDLIVRNLKNHLYTSKGGKNTLILNVESRNKVIEHLLNDPNKIFGEFEDEEAPDESIINILSRYEDITVLFPEELRTEDVLPLFIEWLLERVILIEVKAYSMENAYTIFETMNDRGMTLSPTEILKGFLLSKITDEAKSEEANEFWKNRISQINRDTKLDADLDFFRAWLRAKYAISTRATKIGAENEDFEIIATQFHSWVKNNTKKVYLKESSDYYFFIVSDFNFYSDLYIKIFEFKNYDVDGYNDIYVNNFYPIADSLYYPLIISPISKIDDEDTIRDKTLLINKFIDIYTNIRVLSNKSITQSSIRYYIYDLIRDIRNSNFSELRSIIIEKFNELKTKDDGYKELQQMNNWGYYHYFFARVLHFLSEEPQDFQELIRSKKQSSFILHRIFEERDFDNELNNLNYNPLFDSVANFCLIRRYHIDEYNSKRNSNTKLRFLMNNNYLPEMHNIDSEISSVDFIRQRDNILNAFYYRIWSL
ncbi:DUF262 domain-containing protein [Elizabethkingia anophelis]|nr:DUF262 domain-containing protein [Elizabethkingia anophelis]MCT3822444.1 DUF262 domain-containing protein [Elizabethkingia anophelis]MCT3928791.1 DUF262 domain-containing protein [Elizabethkingia anophelis]MCT4075921.1 DUF262 domain-containing protein [Elizabethkingia anophelis]MCT4078560.1 DUF262 domain-containing protein [Elizabethkingia anophelis]